VTTAIYYHPARVEEMLEAKKEMQRPRNIRLTTSTDNISNSMEKNPHRKAGSHLAVKKISEYYKTRL
jgi:hypothetical protein